MRKFISNLWNDESAQGTSEYILLLVAIIAVAFIFKGKIIEIVKGQMDGIGSKIGTFSSEGQ